MGVGTVYSFEPRTQFRISFFLQGPVACTINANPLRDYEGGIIDDPTASSSTNHIVSIVGFGKDEESGKDYWIIRNSWGEYWGVSSLCLFIPVNHRQGMSLTLILQYIHIPLLLLIGYGICQDSRR